MLCLIIKQSGTAANNSNHFKLARGQLTRMRSLQEQSITDLKEMK
jgi:hypothetical protein